MSKTNEYVSVQQPDKQTFQQFLDIIKDLEEVSGKCLKCAFVDAAEKEVDRLRKLVAEDEARLNHAEKEIEGLRKQIKTIEAYNTGT